jgi:hypothetical protein
MAIQFPIRLMHRTTLCFAALAAALYGGPGCSSKPPAESDGAAPVVERYIAPPEGTASLVQSLSVHRDRNSQTVVDGRLLLPAGTRIWVELFSITATPSAEPIGRAELYLGPGGSFQAGPFNLPGITQCRIQVTSHFSRSWQAPEILSVIGLNGTKLPKSSLRPNDPSAPQSGGHFEYTSTVNVGA